MIEKKMYSQEDYDDKIKRESVIGARVGIIGFIIFIYADMNVLNYPINITFFRLIVISSLTIYLIMASKRFKFSLSKLKLVYGISMSTTLLFVDYLLINHFINPNFNIELNRIIQVAMLIVIGVALLGGNIREHIAKILISNVFFFMILLFIHDKFSIELIFRFFNFIFCNIAAISFNQSYHKSRLNEHMVRLKLQENLGSLELELDEKSKLQTELSIKATTDEMTAALNRSCGLHMFKKLFEKTTKTKESFCICFFDLDGLKNINDIYGHKVGDDYILDFTNTVNENIRSTDFFSRFGGDEFLLIVPNIEQIKMKDIVEKIVDRTKYSVDDKKRPYEFDVSYGIASYEERTFKDEEDMLELADIRMYEMKQIKKTNQKIEMI